MDQQDALFSINYSNNKPPHISSRLPVHHQKDQLGINSNWYSNALCWLAAGSLSTQRIIWTNWLIYCEAFYVNRMPRNRLPRVMKQPNSMEDIWYIYIYIYMQITAVTPCTPAPASITHTRSRIHPTPHTTQYTAHINFLYNCFLRIHVQPEDSYCWKAETCSCTLVM